MKTLTYLLLTGALSFAPQPLFADPKAAYQALQDGHVEEAVKECQRSAETGQADAQVDLGYLYENGRGVLKDYTEALRWYLKAAEQGDPYGQFAAGVFYDLGRGVSRNDKEALKWYRKAAAQGDDKAQFNLASMYAEGRGVKKSDREAYFWFALAAQGGEEIAMTKRDEARERLDEDVRADVDRLLEKWNMRAPKKRWPKPFGLLV